MPGNTSSLRGNDLIRHDFISCLIRYSYSSPNAIYVAFYSSAATETFPGEEECVRFRSPAVFLYDLDVFLVATGPCRFPEPKCYHR